jgi:hypothetical protein
VTSKRAWELMAHGLIEEREICCNAAWRGGAPVLGRQSYRYGELLQGWAMLLDLLKGREGSRR